MPGPAALFSARTESSSCSRTSRMRMDMYERSRAVPGPNPARRGRIIARDPHAGDRRVRVNWKLCDRASVTFGPGRYCRHATTIASMTMRMSHTQLLRYAGLFTWAVVGLPLILGELKLGQETNPALIYAAIAYVSFGAAYWFVTRGLGDRGPRWHDILLLVVLTTTAILFTQFTGTGLGSILLMIVAGVIPWLVPIRVGVVWLVLQHVALVPTFSRLEGFTLNLAILQAGMYVGYSSFTFVTGL